MCMARMAAGKGTFVKKHPTGKAARPTALVGALAALDNVAMNAIPGLQGGPLRYVPEFDPAVPAADFGARGVVLHAAFGWLDLLARLNGLTSLQNFCDHRPVPGGMDKWLKKLEKLTPEQVWNQLVQARDKASGPWTDWFPVEQGVTTIDGLLTILQREGWRQAVDVLSEGFPFLRKKKGSFEPASVPEVV